ncbi:MAG: thioredoxin family protein [Anaerolineaceae bacterium]|jgi:glutaredoxin-like protein|nr:thioredoxin family protein [Anaerolineaceae bacterium]
MEKISMEKLLNAEVQSQVLTAMKALRQPVKIQLFISSDLDCTYCKETRQLMEEIAALSDLIDIEVLIFEEHPELAAQLNVDKTPTTILMSQKDGVWVDRGIRFAGIPAGNEFTSVIRSLIMVSMGDSGLSAATRQYLDGLNEKVNLQVFVTPTCPYCPQAVILAHQMAFESAWVEAEMVEAIEFSDLSDRFGVSGVPHTSINFGIEELIGAAPETMLVEKIKEALAGAV